MQHLAKHADNVEFAHHITNTHVQLLAPLSEALTGLLGFRPLPNLLKAQSNIFFK